MDLKELMEKQTDQYNTLLKIRYWAKVLFWLLVGAAVIKYLFK